MPGGMRNGVAGSFFSASVMKSLNTGADSEPPVSLSPSERG